MGKRVMVRGSGLQWKHTASDALPYLKGLKKTFRDKPGKYDDFLQIMIDYKHKRIDTAGVVTRLTALFKGHPDLIQGFNTFLPEGYGIPLGPEYVKQPSQKKALEFDQALDFIDKVKKRFQGSDYHAYQAFLHILKLYKKYDTPISKVYEEVAALFKDHQDLLREFAGFLPDDDKCRLLTRNFSTASK